MENNKVILVNENDVPKGEMNKLEAHKKGILHRAYSVFVFNEKNELLLQQRSINKYHSGGLWSNTCCSHPQPDEDIRKSASDCLIKEMGIRCQLEYTFKFIYHSEFDNGLVENELDHVFVGKTSDLPKPNPDEVSNWQAITLSDLESSITKSPEKFTPWLKICLPKLRDYLASD